MHTVAGADESGPSNEVPLHVNVPVPPSAPANVIGLVNGSSLALAWKNTYLGGPPSNLVLDVSGAFNGSFSLGVTGPLHFPAVPLAPTRCPCGPSTRADSERRRPTPSRCVPVALLRGAAVARQLPRLQEGSTLFVVWDPPASGPAPTSYLVNVSGAFVASIPTAVRTLSGTVGPGSYGLSVAAVNPCGASAATPEQVVVIP